MTSAAQVGGVRLVDGRLAYVITDDRAARVLHAELERWRAHLTHVRRSPPSAVLNDLADGLGMFTTHATLARLAVAACGNDRCQVPEPPSGFVTTAVAAKALGVADRTLRHRASRGAVNGAKRHGGRWCIPVAYIAKERQP